ncbi:MAG: hypothetical protein WBB19_11525 [Desulforhopalus sp.]
MAQKTVAHKGYHGTIDVDTKDYSLYGKILFIDEEFTYSGQSFAELEEDFRKAVEKHIELCKEKGLDPPFSE